MREVTALVVMCVHDCHHPLTSSIVHLKPLWTTASVVCWQLLTTWSIVFHLPQGLLSVVKGSHFLRQDAQWSWLVRKWFISD